MRNIFVENIIQRSEFQYVTVIDEQIQEFVNRTGLLKKFEIRKF